MQISGYNFTVHYRHHFQRMNDLNHLKTDFNFLWSTSHKIKLNSVPFRLYVAEDRLDNPMLCKPYVITAEHLLNVAILFDGIVDHNIQKETELQIFIWGFNIQNNPMPIIWQNGTGKSGKAFLK